MSIGEATSGRRLQATRIEAADSSVGALHEATQRWVPLAGWNGARETDWAVPTREAATDVAEMAQALPWGQDEAEFLTELQAGSETAFDWLVTHYHAPVYNLVYGMLGDSADAADVTQEVFIKAFRAIKGFRHGSSLKTWLYRIAVRQALNQRRWWWRHLRLQTSIDVDANEDQRPLELESHEASPFDRLASHEVQQVVRGALAKVSEPFRAAVILRDLEGLAYEEVAEVLEVSVGTVKSRILRGRRALKDILEPLLNGKERPQPAQPTPGNYSRAANSFSTNMTKTIPARAAQKPRWELRRTELRGGGE